MITEDGPRRTFCPNLSFIRHLFYDVERYLCVEKAKIKPKNNIKTKL